MENNKSEIILIPKFEEVPSKEEITTGVRNYLAVPDIPLIHKYVTLKTLEKVVEEGLNQTIRKEVIDSALEFSGGANKFDYCGAKIQITSERKDSIMKEYQYSVDVENMEKEIAEMEADLKTAKDNLKALKIREINSGTAVDITKELTGESKDPEYGIKVTLPKN